MRFVTGSVINLNFSGADTLANIIDTDNPAVTLAPATYTAAQLNQAFGVSSFTGPGALTITVPEPSTWIGILTLVGMFGLARRRQVG